MRGGTLLASFTGISVGLAVLCGGLRAGMAPLQRLETLLAAPAGAPLHRHELRARGSRLLLPCAGVAAVAVALALLTSVVVLAAAPPVAVIAWRWYALHRRAADLRDIRAFVLELCPALAAELRGGQLPSRALGAAVSGVGSAGRTPASGAQGLALAMGSLAVETDPATVASGLAGLAVLPGAQGLAAVAVCWDVVGATGSGLAPAIDRVAGALRAEAAVRREIEGQLAAPRASARLLAGLPVLGLICGALLGAHPTAVLLGSTWGRGCLVAGVTLAGLGMAWVGRIAHAADPSRRR